MSIENSGWLRNGTVLEATLRLESQRDVSQSVFVLRYDLLVRESLS